MELIEKMRIVEKRRSDYQAWTDMPHTMRMSDADKFALDNIIDDHYEERQRVQNLWRTWHSTKIRETHRRPNQPSSHALLSRIVGRRMGIPYNQSFGLMTPEELSRVEAWLSSEEAKRIEHEFSKYERRRSTYQGLKFKGEHFMGW